MSDSGFRVTSFTELIKSGVLQIGDGYRAKLSELRGGGLPFLRGALLSAQGMTLEGAERFLADLTPLLESKTSRPGDTVVTTKGNSTGRTGFVPDDFPTFVYSPHLSYWRSVDANGLVPGFLRYWAQGREFREQLDGMKVSTDMAPYLSLADQRRLRITLPSIDEQRAIARVLGALDDKIELNRQMNRTLEAMAQALFKSWFVDFDPVVAKAAGRQPFGMDAETAALFPSRFVESELGPIPEGWRVSPIGDVVRVVGGSTPSTGEAAFWAGGNICWTTPKDLSVLADPVLLDTERHITEAGLGQISSGLLPRGTVLLSSRAPIGYVAIARVPTAVNQGFIAMVCDRDLPTYYVFHWTRENLDEVLARAGGTTFAEISKANFRPIAALVPPSQLLTAFEARVAPLFERVAANVAESGSLAALRDALLPKLLSGKVRVRDAEGAIEGGLA